MSDMPARVKRHLEKHDRMARHNGIELLEVEEGRAVARMTVTPNHLNSVHSVHGGAVFTLADLAFAAAANARGTVSLALNLHISFVKAAVAGDVLTATVEEVHFGRRIATYEIRVADQEGALVATAHATAYRKKDPLPFDPEEV